MPRYGRRNNAHLASRFARNEPGAPMWAVDLRTYRPGADDDRLLQLRVVAGATIPTSPTGVRP